uniref:Phospholipid-transporting ATPase n=1 Tax=Panagrolaimus sp. ES5 TaxID=591445 RepID=A0AC34FA08_9BILA
MPQHREVSRHIKVNTELQTRKFCSNEISTCKYNAISFLPRFLLEQFRRYSNIFFLVIALLQQIPDVSPTGRYTTAVPFLMIMAISAIKEIFEDLIKVGDIIKITDGHVFPADIVLLTSSEHHGLAYIETSNLDGETNLKIRQAPKVSVEYNTKEKLEEMLAEIECEGPNKNIANFAGTLLIHNNKYALKANELLLRGARLKNTAWVYGAVVYTGHDAKLLRNSKTAPLKRSTIDMLTNNRIIFLFFVLVALALVCGGGAKIYDIFYLDDAWYLGKIAETNFAWNVLTFFILYNNLIPISLQVTLELVRFFQAGYINQDIQMYDEESDTAANARTSNLNEELGQVQYIMTDKTGTLTRNIMKFKKCSVQGISYGNDEDDSFRDGKLVEDFKNDNSENKLVCHFLTLMAVCHTIVPEEKEDGKVEYHGSSPDESALVRGASRLGFIFETRAPDHVIIKKHGEEIKYNIDHTIDFDSDRKRMSVICHTDEGKYIVYTKGAAEQHLSEYAEKGYRTLCLCYRTLEADFYKKWSEKYSTATTAVPKDEKAVAELENEIETDMIFLGATAIEDKLQDYVPETIMAMKKADIKVWMLTGDKKETAINIAQSSALIDSKTQLHIIQHKNDIYKIKPSQLNNFTLAISGNVVKDVISTEHKTFVNDVVLKATTVVCYRMTPSQKAEIVEMVQKASNGVVLSVGDGANDVAMIQAANVGVGITGQEGLQAASSSDYSIAQFHFLRRLLLVHGAFNHDRTVKVILYSFYKNICLYIIELWFAFFSAFSGQTIFDRWTIALFNVVFTAFPPIMLGLFDRPVKARTMLEYPQLYRKFQERAFSNRIFALWIALSLWHSLLLFFLTYLIMENSILWESGEVGGWLMLGCSAYTYVVVTVCLKALLEADTWTAILLVFCFGSILSWFVFMIIYSEVWPWISIGADMKGIAWMMMSSGTFWAGLVFVPTVTLLIDFIIKGVQTSLFPSPRDLMVMKEKEDAKRKNVHTIRVRGDSDEYNDDPITNPATTETTATERDQLRNNIKPEYGSVTQLFNSNGLENEDRALINSPPVENGAYTNPVMEDVELGTVDHSARFNKRST